MEGLIVREATMADKDGILGIHDNIYDGVDYLPACFDYFMSCANTKGYVGVMDGKIVTFNMAFLVDDGETVITRAGRTNPDYERRGIHAAIANYETQMSGAKETSHVTLGTKDPISTDSHKQKNTLVLSKDMYRYEFKPNGISTDALTTSGNRHITELTDNDLQLYMNSDLLRKYLFPDDIIVINWVPFRLLPSNIPFMRIPGRTNLVTNVEVDGDRIKGLVSSVTVYESKQPPFTCNLDIYGSDVQSLKHHISAQVEFLKKRVDGELCLLVFVDEQLCGTAVKDAFESFGIARGAWLVSPNSDTEYCKQLVFRKTIVQSHL